MSEQDESQAPSDETPQPNIEVQMASVLISSGMNTEMITSAVEILVTSMLSACATRYEQRYQCITIEMLWEEMTDVNDQYADIVRHQYWTVEYIPSRQYRC